MFLGRSDPRQLWARYLVAISLIITLIVGSHFVHLKALNDGALDAKIINISGQQRMLSQRILLLALRLQTNTTLDYAALLSQATTRFRDNHDWLRVNAVRSDGAVMAYSHPDGMGLDHRSREYISLAESVLARAQENEDFGDTTRTMEAIAIKNLLSDLNAAVVMFEGESDARADSLGTLQNGTLMLALILLMLEGAFIFWPAQRSVNEALKEIEQRRREVEARNARLEKLSQDLKHAADHDQLTNLPNRKVLEQILTGRLRDPRIDRSSICVMHADLDGFKNINDTLGHPVGDEVLRRAAAAMTDSVRHGDVVARFGGDEFVLVLTLKSDNVDDLARRIGERIINSIRQPMTINGHTCTVGASIGYAFADEDTDTADTLVGNADVALYEAKRAGKGIALPFGADLRTARINRRTLAKDMERALQQGEFVPYFQPKVSLDDGSVSGMEVFARWEHPELGLVTPAEFLDLAEETGLIHIIDEHITHAALDALVQLRADGWIIPDIALNVSARSLRHASLCQSLLAAIATRDLRTSDLVVEVLEASLIERSGDAAAGTVQKLAQAGVRVEMDDFGTGYASLSTLAMLDLSGLKIDRSLVDDLDNPKTRQIVQAIVGLATSMGISATAEGIETSTQFAELKRLGCTYGQGYGIGRPMSLGKVGEWLGGYGRSMAAAN